MGASEYIQRDRCGGLISVGPLCGRCQAVMKFDQARGGEVPPPIKGESFPEYLDRATAQPFNLTAEERKLLEEHVSYLDVNYPRSSIQVIINRLLDAPARTCGGCVRKPCCGYHHGASDEWYCADFERKTT